MRYEIYRVNGDSEGTLREFGGMMQDMSFLGVFRPEIYDHEHAMKILRLSLLSGRDVGYNDVFVN